MSVGCWNLPGSICCCMPTFGGMQLKGKHAHAGLAWLATVAVAHCSDAWGIVFRHRRGWSICFSGDTRPCQNLVQAGAGCTLLVHEATFEADRQQEV